MTEPFDPYRKWLGIPSHDQPPNHYRLLGIESFESDPDVICNAADGRMAQVKNYQTGKHSELSQQILNEIAAAKVCLLNPAKKAKYDQALRQQLAAERTVSAPSVAKPEPKARPKVDLAASPEIPRIKPATVSSYLSSRGGTKRRRRLLVAIGVVAVLMIAILAFLLSQIGGTNLARQPESPKSQDGKAATGGTSPAETKSTDTELPKSEGKPTEPKSPKPEAKPIEPELPEPRVKPPSPEAVLKDEPGETSEQPGAPLRADNPSRLLADLLDPLKSDYLDNDGGDGTGSKDPLVPAPPPGGLSSARRLPVPDGATQKAVEQEIRGIFKKELAAARTSDQKLALAAKLFKEAKRAKDAPADRFMLMQMACDIAAGVGELTSALDMVDQMQRLYAVDPLAMKAHVLTRVVSSIQGGAQALDRCTQVVNTATQLAESAMRVNDFDTTSRFVKLAISAARKTEDTELERALKIRQREIDRLKLRYASVEQARNVLADTPIDGDANLTVGRWRCFTKGDWEKGLPLLLKGSDTKLAALARRDVSRPKGVKDQVALADDWWKLAERETSLAKRKIQSRAVYWYERALPALSGLEKLKVEKRLETLEETPAEPGRYIGGKLSLAEVAKMLELPSARWTIKKDYLEGPYETGNTVSRLPVTASSLEFGFAIKAKWYHKIALDIDGNRICYTRGHQSNTGMMIVSGGKRILFRPGPRVTSPGKWHRLKAVLANGAVTFYYDGQPQWKGQVAGGRRSKHVVRVGFGCHKTTMCLKDFYLQYR